MTAVVVKELIKRLAYIVIGGYAAKKINDAIEKEVDRRHGLNVDEKPKMKYDSEWKNYVQLRKDEYSVT